MTSLRFITIPSIVLARKDLGATEKLVYGCLRFHQGKRGECWPSQATIAEEIGTSRRAVGLAVQRLQAAGWLTVEGRDYRSNVYQVLPADDGTYLRVGDGILSSGLTGLQKLVMAFMEYKANGNDEGRAWPYQETIAGELGCSRVSVVRALSELESLGKIQVDRRVIGRRKRGNRYQLTGSFSCASLQLRELNEVSNLRTRRQTLPALKGKGQSCRYAGLSPEGGCAAEGQGRAEQARGEQGRAEQARGTEPANLPKSDRMAARGAPWANRTARDRRHDGQPRSVPAAGVHERYGLYTPRMDRARILLVEAGVRRDKAEELAFRDHHTPESVLQAILNASVKVLAGGMDPRRRTGYLVGSLEGARREGHVVWPSKLCRQAELEMRRAG